MTSELDAEPEYVDVAAIAVRLGVTRETLRSYLSRGHMPEPDLVWLGINLWLVSTIDEWQSQRYKHGRVRMPRRDKIPTRAPATPATRRLPPKIANAPRLRDSGEVIAEPPVAPVSEVIARQVAAALREAGHYCTTTDVLELTAAETIPDDHERELLQRRILAKVRGLRARATEGGRTTPSPRRS